MSNLSEVPPEIQQKIFGYFVADGAAHTATVISTNTRKRNFSSNRPFAFTSLDSIAFSDVAVLHDRSPAVNYRIALGDHILRDAPVIRVKCKNLQFTNLHRLIAELQRLGLVQQFAFGANSRRIEVQHTITSDLPMESPSLERYCRATDQIVGNGQQPLQISHKIPRRRAEDSDNLRALVNSLGDRQGNGQRAVVGRMLAKFVQKTSKDYVLQRNINFMNDDLISIAIEKIPENVEKVRLAGGREGGDQVGDYEDEPWRDQW